MSKTYTTATACCDALELAATALGMALDAAQAAGLPVFNRINVAAADIDQIRRDADELRKQQES